MFLFFLDFLIINISISDIEVNSIEYFCINDNINNKEAINNYNDSLMNDIYNIKGEKINNENNKISENNYSNFLIENLVI